ncbi:MAG: ankyrin repeat domain-containing protein [Candidatus Cardinium sp.]|nr:MAG: ankyrin repeat domain-containing protein [Candidatus Cardinium sp.]
MRSSSDNGEYLPTSDCSLSDEGEGGVTNQFDWSTVDLCKVYDEQTEFCIVIEKGKLSLLKELLEYIKNNPITYPCGKVIYLIAGCGSEKIKGMKLSLLSRAVLKNNLDIVALLFETLRGYDLVACEKVFSLRFGDGKYTIMHQAVELSSLEIVYYLINTFIKIKALQGLTGDAAWSSLIEILNIRNSVNATPLDVAFTEYARVGHSDSLKILCYLVQYVDPWCYMESKHSFMLHVVAQCSNKERLEGMINVIIEGSKRMANRQDKEMVYKIVHLYR